MTLIFIKLWSGGRRTVVRIAGAPTVSEGARMRDDVQCFRSRAEAAAAANRVISCISTLSLCNANFAPGLA